MAQQKEFNIQIPERFLNRVKYLFLDLNVNNRSPENMTYCFIGGPIECDTHPGYFYIPGYSRYAINLLGEVIVVKTGKVRIWTNTIQVKTCTRGGYVVMPVVTDFGERKSLSRHRAMCITFLSYDLHPRNWVVNHINGVGGDDRLENLQFCTYSENCKHAYDTGLYSNKVVAVDVENWKTGFKASYKTIAACAEELELPHNFICKRLAKSNAIRYPDGWRFKPVKDDWLELNELYRVSARDRVILGKNVLTNEVYIFKRLAHIEPVTGLNANAAQAHCIKKRSIPLNGWIFRFIEDFTCWPEYSEAELEIIREKPFKVELGIKATDITTGKITYHASAKKAGEYLGMSGITVSKCARYGALLSRRYKLEHVDVRKQY